MNHPMPASKNALGLKSILGTETLSADQIQKILKCAFHIRDVSKKTKTFDSPAAGKTVVLLFFEASTRTRGSFEIAAKRLGADTMVVTKEFSSSVKGETLRDTAKTLEAMLPDLLVLRHPSAGSPYHLDQILNIPIINAGDGFHEHPTQALLDLMTIVEFKGDLKGQKVLIVGDIAHSRVARSDIYALNAMGAKVSVCGPPTLLPPHVEKLGVKKYWDLDEAIPDHDVIILLRIQFERLAGGQIPSIGEYTRYYGMTSDRLARCKKDVLVMHPGPMNRGVELAPKVADGPRSVILNQVSNGVLVRMALLHLMLGGEA